MDRKSELALVEAAINGDTESFTELCQRYYPAMVAIAHSLLGDRHSAEDAAQEAFAKAFCRLSKLRKKERFACWLTTICRNVSRDMDRAGSQLSNPEKLTRIATPSEDEDNELTEAVREAVRHLSRSLKEVIFLRYYNDMAYDQISEVLVPFLKSQYSILYVLSFRPEARIWRAQAEESIATVSPKANPKVELIYWKRH